MEKEFINLIKENENMILKICNIYCREVHDREDLYQDIVIQLWKAYPTFDYRAKISTWLYRIALNTAVSRYRKQEKVPRRETISDSLSVVDQQEGSDRSQSLNVAISALNKIERAIIMLYMEGLKYREIGEIMGLTESNVGFKLNQIKGKLRKKLKN